MTSPMRDASLLAALLLVSGASGACSDRSAVSVGVSLGAASAVSPTASSAPTGTASALVTTTASVATAADGGAATVASAGAELVDAGRAGGGPCPDGMALVQRFCIDRFEAHLVAPGVDGVPAALPHNERPPADVRFEARVAPGVMPQAYISRVEAAAACKNAGKRLCSMHEWRRACEGPGEARFPYGDHRVAGRCNHEKGHVLSKLHGGDARRWTYENFNDPALDAEPGFLAKTGEYEGCVSREGVFDLVGNLHEWVSDMVDPDLVSKLEAEDVERRTQPWKEGNGVFMGGFFSTADQHGPGCTFTTIAHEPTYHDYSVGFRCCAAADLPPPVRKTPGRAPR
jgi:formylglycine-generating enzyme